MGYPALSDNEEENQAHSKDHGHEEPRVKDEMEGEDQGIGKEFRIAKKENEKEDQRQTRSKMKMP